MRSIADAYDDSILNMDGSMIDQRKMHFAARLGGDWYSKIGEDNLFRVEKPSTQLGIGIDVLPESIRDSKILSGNDLGQLANVQEMPMIDPAFHDDTLKNIFQYYSISPEEMEKELQRYAKQLLEQEKPGRPGKYYWLDFKKHGRVALFGTKLTGQV
jgi:hypothetical protein